MEQGIDGIPDGIALGNLCPLLVNALLLSPCITHHVVGKLRTVKCGRWRKALDQIRQFLGRVINRFGLILRPDVHGSHQGCSHQ